MESASGTFLQCLFVWILILFHFLKYQLGKHWEFDSYFTSALWGVCPALCGLGPGLFRGVCWLAVFPLRVLLSSLLLSTFSLVFFDFTMVCLDMDLLLFILLGILMFSQIWTFFCYLNISSSSLSQIFSSETLIRHIFNLLHMTPPCHRFSRSHFASLCSVSFIYTYFPFHQFSDHLCLISDPTNLKLGKYYHWLIFFCKSQSSLLIGSDHFLMFQFQFWFFKQLTYLFYLCFECIHDLRLLGISSTLCGFFCLPHLSSGVV